MNLLNLVNYIFLVGCVYSKFVSPQESNSTELSSGLVNITRVNNGKSSSRDIKEKKRFYTDPDFKIAFLFLTRGPMPLEPVWKRFFEWNAKESEYSIYIHPPKDFKYPEMSIFYGREVKNRVYTHWGAFGLIAAEKVLFMNALKDPLNEWFFLLSESCIPLHPLSMMRKAIVAGGKSVLNACWAPAHFTKVDKHFHENLSLAGLSRKNFRKSEQWVALNRKHASIVVEEQTIAEQFKLLSIKFSDEHYIPTVLAHYNQSEFTTCSSGFTFTNWHYIHSPHTPKPKHPKVYMGWEVSTLLERLNKSQWNRRKEPINKGYSNGCAANPVLCHFMARKFDHKASPAILKSLSLILYNTTQ